VTKQFWLFLVLGLIGLALGVTVMYRATAPNRLELTGQILKVRTVALSRKATLAVVDFRLLDSTNVPFVVKSVEMKLETASGEKLDGTPVAKPDVEALFNYNKLLGPKFNPVLSIKDKIKAGERADRMTAARFELSDADAAERRAIHLRIEELDGVVFELTEKK
jgi:hypothetical protein